MFSIFKKKVAPEVPECWNNYLELFQEKQNPNISISEVNFVILDVESTGLDPKRDKILSMGAVKIINNQIKISNSFELYIDQSEFNPENVPIHGIIKNGNNVKVSEKDALLKLIEYIENYTIVGHGIAFDISIINQTLKRYNCGKLLNKILDTVSLYKRLKGADYKIGDSTSLDTLSEEFTIPQSDRHNAAGDALITGILFLKILTRLKRRGVETLNDLQRVKKILL